MAPRPFIAYDSPTHATHARARATQAQHGFGTEQRKVEFRSKTELHDIELETSFEWRFIRTP